MTMTKEKESWMGTDHHADGMLLSSRSHFQTVIHHQVHKGVKPPKDALHMSASI